MVAFLLLSNQCHRGCGLLISRYLNSALFLHSSFFNRSPNEISGRRSALKNYNSLKWTNSLLATYDLTLCVFYTVYVLVFPFSESTNKFVLNFHSEWRIEYSTSRNRELSIQDFRSIYVNVYHFFSDFVVSYVV